MYALGYNKLFWGMIFIIFNINLGAINILPNFIGYILIYSGLDVLQEQHEIYKRGKIPAIILVALTFKDVVHTDKTDLLSSGFQGLNISTMLIGSIVTIINIYLIYIICKGIYYISENRGLDVFKKRAETAWKNYFVAAVLMIFYTPFSLNISYDFNIIMVILSIIQVVAMISIAMLFRNSKVELRE